jgi:hypothetical protein
VYIIKIKANLLVVSTHYEPKRKSVGFERASLRNGGVYKMSGFEPIKEQNSRFILSKDENSQFL